MQPCDATCNIMLFAAGLGTRLRPVTLTYPKPCIPLIQIPLGYYLLPYFNCLNISNFVVNTFHLPDQVHNLYKNLSFASNAKIQFSDEVDFIKGSGGGLKQSEPMLNNKLNTLVCNSDEVIFTENRNFLENVFVQHDLNKALATFVVIKHPDAGTKFGAIWCDENNRVIAIGKQAPTVNAIPWHFIGIQILSPKIFEMITPNIESNIFYDILVHHLENEYMQIYPILADWYETGNLADYSDAKQNILNKLRTLPHYQSHTAELNKIPKLSGLQISDLA